jgi:hypothetical protein
MVRNIIAYFLTLIVLFCSIGKIEAALQRGDIVYRTSPDGYMYGDNIQSKPQSYPGHNQKGILK